MSGAVAGCHYAAAVREIRVVEVMAALSLTTDLATGVPFEKGLQVCLVADRLADELGLDAPTRAAVFQASLLRSIGCTSHAPENAEEFVDDTAFQAALKRLDPGDPETFAGQLRDFGRWAGPGSDLAARFLEIAPTVGPVAAASGCEVSRALAPELGAGERVLRALDEVYERWDGLGIPLGRSGEELGVEARVLHVAEQAVLARATGAPGAARQELVRRAGGHLDPEIARVAVAAGAGLLQPLDAADLLSEVLAREPAPVAVVAGDAAPRLCRVLGTVADLKSTHLLGHSSFVARVAKGAGQRAGLATATLDDLACAALLHNLGCVVVPSSVLDCRPAELGVAGRERMRLQGYWTQRILERCPSLSDLAPLVRGASEHHASFAEGGYLDWRRSADLLPPAALPEAGRLLEAAEAYASLAEPRPGREALPDAEIGALLEAAAWDGRLDPGAVDAVREVAAVAPAVGSSRSALLTAREVQVLGLAARGLTNRAIAQRLGISDRTVGHHLAHVYDKTGRRTRAGVAVWAVERGLLPRTGLP